jgi:hypothetical protein
LREAVRLRLRTLGQHAGPPEGVSLDAWRKHLAALCAAGVIRRFAWEIDGEKFEAAMVAGWWPEGRKPLPLYVAGPRWTDEAKAEDS